jgi:FkbM family methyltransferase
MSFAAKTIIKSGKVIAIEANPNTYKALLANNELNMNPLEVHNYALGESNGFLMISNLHADDCNSINGSVQSKETYKNYLKVKSTKLDFLLSELKKIDFIKIDVEGFELAVLKGALECIKKTRYIYLELGDRLNAKYGYKSLDVIKLLKSLNFKIRIIENFQQRDLPDEINFNNVHMFLAINKSLDG